MSCNCNICAENTGILPQFCRDPSPCVKYNMLVLDCVAKFFLSSPLNTATVALSGSL